MVIVFRDFGNLVFLEYPINLVKSILKDLFVGLSVENYENRVVLMFSKVNPDYITFTRNRRFWYRSCDIPNAFKNLPHTFKPGYFIFLVVKGFVDCRSSCFFQDLRFDNIAL